MKTSLAVLFTLTVFNLSAKDKMFMKLEADSIYVSKSKKEMILYQNGKVIRSYAVSIGENEIGHKQRQGDNRTPEGLYTINDRNPNSKYFRNLGISYPNEHDIAEAARKKANAGGDIKIHGYTDKHGSAREKYVRYESTWGCIGVCNADMEEIYEIVKIGAKILITP